MNPDIKARWVERLRTEGPKKATAQLRDCDGYFSAGGILCDLAVQDGIIDPPTDLTSKVGRDSPMFFGWTYGGLGVSIPEEVANWAGLKSRAVWSLDYKVDCGLSLAQAAEVVEKEF